MNGTLTIHTDEYHKVHDELCFQAYSEVTGKPIDNDLIQDYREQYKKFGGSSGIFASLGKPPEFWINRYETIDQDRYYNPDPDIFLTLNRLKDLILISLFTSVSLVNAKKTLESVSINPSWFTHIISRNDVDNGRPAPEGFEMMIEKSSLKAENILYVGDRVKLDIVPANKVGIQSGLIYGESELADYNFENFSDILSIM